MNFQKKAKAISLSQRECASDSMSRGVPICRQLFRKKHLLNLLGLFFLGIILSLPARGQKMDVYPNELNVNLSGCSSATVKTITVENIGTEDLSYSMYGSLIDPLSTGEVIESYGSFSSGSWGAELVDGFLYTTNNYNGTIEKYDLEKQTIVSSFSVISSPLHIAYFDDCFWVSQYGSKTIYCYDINGNKIDKTIIAPVSNPLITSDGTSLYVAPYNTGSTTYIQT